MVKRLDDKTAVESAFYDPDNTFNEVYFKTINGVVVDWLSALPVDAENGQKYVELTPFADGTIGRVYQFGALYPPALDDAGATSNPGAGQTVLAGSFTYVVTDETNDVSGSYNFYRTGITSAPPPSQLTNAVPPTISGNTSIGSVLTYNQDAVWINGTGTVTETIRWYRSNDLGNFIAIPGETGITYTTQAADDGRLIRIQLNAQDDNYPPPAEALSNSIQMDATANIALANISLPSISGTPTVGNTLTGTVGSWTGDTPITLSHQWLRNGSPIVGATALTYTLVSADDGTQVSLQETAVEGGGDLQTASVTSGALSVSVPGTLSHDVLKQQVLDEFATSPNKGWNGFPDETGFTIYTATTPAEVYSRISSWANGNPATDKIKIYCNWNGVLTGSNSALGVVKTAKLTPGTEWAGYQIPSGGVWLENTAGMRPVFGNRVELIGITRLHVKGVHFAGILSTSATAEAAFRVRATSTFPLNGCIYFENVNLGHMDNRGTVNYSEICKGMLIDNTYSYRHHNVRIAGSRNVMQIQAKYIWREFTDAQQFLGDFRFTAGNAGGPSSFTYVYDNMSMFRDLIQNSAATGLHTDTNQFGSFADSHAGYIWCFENNIGHLKSSLATDSGSQGWYNDDATAPRKFEGTLKQCISAFGAYHGFTRWDPSQAGRMWLENCMFLRAGEPDPTGQDTWEQVNISAGNASGGSLHLENVTMTRVSGNTGYYTANNLRFVDPRANVVNGTGLTQASPLRFENAIAGFANVSRDGADKMTYILPGENSTNAATAYQALLDFYEPRGSTWAAEGWSWPAWTETAP